MADTERIIYLHWCILDSSSSNHNESIQRVCGSVDGRSQRLRSADRALSAEAAELPDFGIWPGRLARDSESYVESRATLGILRQAGGSLRPHREFRSEQRDADFSGPEQLARQFHTSGPERFRPTFGIGVETGRQPTACGSCGIWNLLFAGGGQQLHQSWAPEPVWPAVQSDSAGERGNKPAALFFGHQPDCRSLHHDLERAKGRRSESP